MADILPISDKFKAHLEECYQNINRSYYGQDIESPTLNVKCADYNSPTPGLTKNGRLGQNMYYNDIPPIGIVNDSIYKWSVNRLASLGAISVMCPELKSWKVEYIEPFKRENYPLAIAANSAATAAITYISGRYCINSYIIDDSFYSGVSKSNRSGFLNFNHVTDFNYSDICCYAMVKVVNDRGIANYEETHDGAPSKNFSLHDYWEGWFDESAGIKNYQQYPNILNLSVTPYVRRKSETKRDANGISLQTRWHARNLRDWKQYMTHHTDYEPTFISDELIQDAPVGFGVSGMFSQYTTDLTEAFEIRTTSSSCLLDTTPEGTFTQRTAYKSSTTRRVEKAFLKPVDVLVRTAVNLDIDNNKLYCMPYMRCEDFTKEKMLREIAYLGFWFTDNEESAKNSTLDEDCTDPHVYCPIFDEDFVTTGRYISGKDLDSTPPPVIPVKRGEYITIYDSRTPQDKFDTHGLGVLNPTVCEISETLNGSYTLSIEHPIDPYNKWRYIKVHNIIKALGQLFIIRVVEENWSGSKGSVTANAEHIFYGLNDYLLPHGRSFSASGARNWAKDYIYVALTVAKEAYFDGATNYEYSYGINDRTPVTSEFRDKWNITPEPLNISQLIIGENMLLADTNTQLYRDNFYFSLYERKENTKDNAFEIRIGLNLTGIKRTVDSSTLVTHFTGYTDNGEAFAISWDTGGTLGLAPHTIKKEMKIDASSWNDLVKQVYDFWGKNCFLLTSYEVDLEEVSTNSDFEEFTGKADYTVGNKGIIYDKRLGERLELQITGTVTDAIRNKVKRVSFGGTRSFVGNNLYQPVVQETPTAEVNAFQQVRDLEGNFCFDSGGNRIIQNVIGV